MKKNLLIHIVRTVGHFQVYAHNITLWALSCGLNVIYCGPTENTLYFKRYGKNPSVHFIDIGKILKFDLTTMNDETIVNEVFSFETAKYQLEYIVKLQREFCPLCTFLINTDNFIFTYPFEKKEISFPSPTFGILTFSNRNSYTGFEEIYTWRLREMLKHQSPFTALFTLDEYHVKRRDPEQKYLKFLPDLYQEFDIEDYPSSEKNEKIYHLTNFLNKTSFPIIPIIGKFDDRKNNLLILELSKIYHELGFVILGQREPSTKNDAEIDHIINNLVEKDRVYKKFSFVDQALIDLVIAHPSVPFIPLPYHAHYGSSGMQLLAMKHRKPTLVPDNGLMGRRIIGSGAGMVFRVGDDNDFKEKFRAMLNIPPGAYNEAINEFMPVFSKAAIFNTLNAVMNPQQQSSPLPYWVHENTTASSTETHAYHHYYKAIRIGNTGKYTLAVRQLDHALANAPYHRGMVFRKALFLFFQGDIEQASQFFRIQGNDSEKQFFILRMTEFLRAFPRQKTYPDPMPFVKNLLLHTTTLEAETLRTMGILCVLFQNYSLAEKAFRQALCQDTNRHDIRLHLSDTLRYTQNYSKSLKVLKELEELCPKTPGLHYKRGQIFFEKGNLRQAQKEMKREISSKHQKTEFQYLAEKQIKNITGKTK